jgi:hypothetical protein
MFGQTCPGPTGPDRLNWRRVRRSMSTAQMRAPSSAGPSCRRSRRTHGHSLVQPTGSCSNRALGFGGLPCRPNTPSPSRNRYGLVLRLCIRAPLGGRDAGPARRQSLAHHTALQTVFSLHGPGSPTPAPAGPSAAVRAWPRISHSRAGGSLTSLTHVRAMVTAIGCRHIEAAVYPKSWRLITP